jgi:tetratricopeptide (TPR) repeat protein
LYLANELDHEGNAQAAAVHYRVALNRIAQQPAANRPAPEKLIAIVLRMASCQVRASETEQAIQSYQLASKIAGQTKQTKLESVADVNEASLQQKAGRLDQALSLYQHALQLDDSIGDRASTAEDWFAYGRLLEGNGLPVQLVYACYVKSATLQDALPDASQRQLLSEARSQAERRVGSAAATIRHDPEPALREALALRR